MTSILFFLLLPFTTNAASNSWNIKCSGAELKPNEGGQVVQGTFVFDLSTREFSFSVAEFKATNLPITKTTETRAKDPQNLDVEFVMDLPPPSSETTESYTVSAELPTDYSSSEPTTSFPMTVEFLKEDWEYFGTPTILYDKAYALTCEAN